MDFLLKSLSDITQTEISVGSMDSSGGHEEYDSRAAFSTFTTNSLSPSHLRTISTASPPPPPLPSTFDPLSNYIQLQPWPRPMRSDPDPSSSHPIIFQATTVPESNDRVESARNTRKRSRASRRDPTTVLTTDTANFRAMVQEFTGVPTPPFNGTSFSRTRFDLLGTRSAAFEAAQPHLRRPLAHQLPIARSSELFNVGNPNSLTTLLQSNPRIPHSNSNAAASKPQDEDSFGIPSSEFDYFDLSIDENHASTILSELPNLVSPDQMKTRGFLR